MKSIPTFRPRSIQTTPVDSAEQTTPEDAAEQQRRTDELQRFLALWLLNPDPPSSPPSA
jgi:hypothetical protein